MHTTILSYALRRLSVSLRTLQRAFRGLGQKAASAMSTLAHFTAAQRRLRLMGAETAGGAAALYGVSHWSTPAAFILGGIAVVAAVEMRA